MKMNNLNRRIEKNQLAKLAGEYFVDTNSTLIRDLRKQGLDVFVGIRKDEHTWTILGDHIVIYSTINENFGKTTIDEFLECLKSYTLARGKSENYEYIRLGDDEIWVDKPAVMTALWNTALFLRDKEK